SLDAAAPETYARFAAAAGDRHELFLSPVRALALGLERPTGALVALGGVSFAEAFRLGTARDAATPDLSRNAGPLHCAACTLARAALLLPVLACVEVAPGDTRFEGCVEIDLKDLSWARTHATSRFEIVARTRVPLKDVGDGEFVVFRGGLAQRDQVAIVVGEIDPTRPVPVRIHSSCITGDLFGSLKCDCGDQLRRGLVTLKDRGGGVLLYLDQEGRGTGIAAKMGAYGLQAEGLDTVEADAILGFGPDERHYEAAVAMLRGLGIASVDLLTNNPAKATFLERAGIRVAARTPVLGDVTPQNLSYLRTKTQKSGHLFDLDSLIAAAP
ncbi:GTP cyclohydrolase II RibA, partial [Aureimonas sp. AU12]|uniref:GTP cyclohydrolase II RibA n=1 Tax=Aureimonas sp. AU12 TaxID=1638161 RepID=UPI000780C830